MSKQTMEEIRSQFYNTLSEEIGLYLIKAALANKIETALIEKFERKLTRRNKRGKL